MWRVSVHHDQVTCLQVVVHYLQTLCSFSFDDAVSAARQVDRDGSADVAERAGRDEAEELAVLLQRRGIHAMVRSA